MARLFTSGLEVQSPSTTPSLDGESIAGGVLSSTLGSTSINTSTPRSGAACLACPAGATFILDNAITTFGRHYYLRAYQRVSTVNPTVPIRLLGAQVFVAVNHARLNTDGTVSLVDTSGAQIGSPSSVLSPNTWYRIELHLMCQSAGTGTLEMRINGALIASSTTAATGNSMPLQVRIGHNSSGETSGCVVLNDDIAINDDTGTNQNSWCGPGSVLLAKPVADSANTNWVGLGGSTSNLWAHVDNRPPLGVAFADDPDPPPPPPPPPPGPGEAAQGYFLWGGPGPEPRGTTGYTDATLDLLAEHGFKWISVWLGRIKGFGGTQDYRGSAPPATGTNWANQRAIEESDIVARAHARGLKVSFQQLSCRIVNGNTVAIAMWDDDATWATYCQRQKEIAQMVAYYGGDQISTDWEVFDDPTQPSGWRVSRAWWWNFGEYPGTQPEANTNGQLFSEDEVRMLAEQRGEQWMNAWLDGGVKDFLLYNVWQPDSWRDVGVASTGSTNPPNGDRVQWDTMLGMLRAQGYDSVWHTNATLQKTPQWGNASTEFARYNNANRWETNNLFAKASRDLTVQWQLSGGVPTKVTANDWKYAAPRLATQPMSWLDEPQQCCGNWKLFTQKNTVAEVTNQLESFRDWSMGGVQQMFDFSGFDFNFSFNGNRIESWAEPQADNTPVFSTGVFDYRPALIAKSQPKIVGADPVLSNITTTTTTITGRATFTVPSGLKQVTWTDNLGGSGACNHNYVITSHSSSDANYPMLNITGDRADWTLQRSRLTAGASSVTFRAEDTHNRVSATQTVNFATPPPPPPPPPPGGETRLWSGASKLLSQNQQSYFNAGFTSFIYSTRSLPGLAGGNDDWERTLLFDTPNNQDYSNSYAGFWLDTADDGPILGGNWLDPNWNNKVLPGLTSFCTRAMNAGFKGIMMDQELYIQNEPNNFPYGWRWDYHAGQSEAAVRAAARAKGEVFGDRMVSIIGNRPVIVYHWSERNGIDCLRALNDQAKQMMRNYVQVEWFQGLRAAGVNLRLIDSDFYKDTGVVPGGPPNTQQLGGQYDDGTMGPTLPTNGLVAANWTTSAQHQKTKMTEYWGADIGSRWEPFVWLTDGPNATQAELAGTSDANIWDRQRDAAWITAQIQGLRASSVNPNNNMSVYAYNLRGGAAQYDAMPGFPGPGA